MPSLKHIVFPVDFSDRSNGAVPFVAEMARKQEATVTLLAVAHLPNMELLEPSSIDPQPILDGLKSRLDQAYLSHFAGLKVDRLAVLGDPAHAIIDFVSANRVDMVMMATHGYSPFRQLLLGSVTAKVLHDVHVPVWTAVHTVEPPAREHVNIRKILCAVDTNAASVELMHWAAGLGKDLGATLRLIHAVPGIEAWPDLQMDRKFEDTLRENAAHTIQNLEKDADLSVPVCIGAGTVPDVVREEALQHGADLILIGRGTLQGKLGRLRTHAYGIIRDAPCPVLSV